MSISLKEKLAKLIFEYDELKFHICPEIEEMYLLSFGFIECEAYNLDIELEMIKKYIELFNNGMNTSDIDSYIDCEFKNSIDMLKKYMEELDLAIEQKEGRIKLSDDELNKLNGLYKDLICYLHPSFNPIRSNYECDLFEEVVEAFENYDLTTMESLVILLPEGKNIFEDDDFFINEINKISQEIYNIKNSYPYNKKQILDDEELFKNYKVQLLDIVANNYLLIEEYAKKLDNLNIL